MQPAPQLLLAAQDCLSNGRPLLIENIEEELDPVLDPVLERRVVKQARGFTMQLGDKEVPARRRTSLPLLLCALDALPAGRQGGARPAAYLSALLLGALEGITASVPA